MAVNLSVFEDFIPVDGVKLGIAQSHVRYPDRDDMVLVELADGTRTAGVFTQNAFCAAPVRVAKQHLSSVPPCYLIINTGNANAGTGPQGMEDALSSCQQVAKACGVSANEVLPFSTGVIGELLDMSAFERGIPVCQEQLSADNWKRAAAGIMTTDTLPKGVSRQIYIDGQSVTISGISKGAGMIQPNMATMLAFVALDAQVDQVILDDWIRSLANASFNRITIDGDTSTNDACLLMATGKGGLVINDASSDAALALFEELKAVFQILAQAIVRDGEGATKFVTIEVEQAAEQQEALNVAYTVAHSPLVKTAMYASDANWGRILAAVGRAGVSNLDLDRIQIYLNDVHIVKNGGRCASYTEEAGSAVFAQSEFTVRIVLGRGAVKEVLWTSDLSHEYVSINADYRS